jgi:hypothetical protein
MRESVEALWGWDEQLQRRIFDERFDRMRFQMIQRLFMCSTEGGASG